MDPTQTIPPAQETSSEILNNKFICYDCSSLLFDKYWKTCIDCDRWICGTCYVGIYLIQSSQKLMIFISQIVNSCKCLIN